MPAPNQPPTPMKCPAMIPMKYAFGIGDLRTQKYKDGTTVPHLKLTIFANGAPWGYVEVHLHKVKVEDREIDISIGTTVRINPAIQAA